MGARYHAEVISDAALTEQRRYYGRAQQAPEEGEPDELGPDERELIESRDSFYLGTITPKGWPYLQHRGGPPGFLRVIDPRTLGFADLRGNRQLVSAGNLRWVDRVSLLLMDYPERLRLKILGRARMIDAREAPELADRLSPAIHLRRRIERLCLITVVGFDWNCPAYITPRYTVAEVEAALTPLRRRVAELEAALAERGER